MNNLHVQYDLLITPQMPITAFEAGHEVPPGGARKRWWEWSPFTYPFNLTQQPTATVPCGLVDGLPVALQLVGAKFSDAKVLRAARAFESMMPFVMPELATADSVSG
jgi:aspartyl-tRNA(Asn)/glutamyl-tRNA(Gln) amidotransferase subunit A